MTSAHRKLLCNFLTGDCHLGELSPADVAGLDKPGKSADGQTTPPVKTLGFVLGTRGRVKVRFDVHFDLFADAIVIDQMLGTIGLVHVCEGETFAQKDISRTLEQAAYLRHLVGEKRSEQREPDKAMPYVVEVVFIDTTGKLAHEIGEVLKGTLGEGALTHALGVGFASSFEKSELQHAFCWLLPSTATWLKALASAPGAKVTPVPWRALEVENLRRRGIRRWTKVEGAGLHVLHGQNGSGKSALVEGFEFFVTGASNRLHGSTPPTPDERRLRRNTASLAPLVWSPRSHAESAPAFAAVRLYLENEKVLTNRTDRPKQHHRVAADGFRLDQNLCDRLISATPEQRANTWLQAFFSEADHQRDERANAILQLRRAVEGLRKADEPAAVDPLLSIPDPSVNDSRTSAAVRRLLDVAQSVAPTQQRSREFTLGEFVAELPGGISLGSKAAHLAAEKLGLKLPAILREPRRPHSDTDELVDSAPLRQDLSAALVHDRAILTRWQSALNQDLFDLLERLDGDVYSGKSDGAGAGGHASINLWLRHVALSDIYSKALVIARTKAGLSAGADDPLAPATPPGSVEDLELQAQDFLGERDRLRAGVESTSARAHRKITARSAYVRVGDLAPLEKAIDAGVFGDLLQRGAKGELRAAVRTRTVKTVGSLRIGTMGWAKPLQHAALQRRSILHALGLLLTSSISPSQRADWIVEAIDAALRFGVLQRRGDELFKAELEKNQLGRAIDELVTLFTPASWAYPPVETKLKTADAAGNTRDWFEFKGVGNHDAAQVLNTAERNTLALVLYLLCAPRVANPYRVIFLDDPLQNMDELTVTAVARGLSRLLRLWSSISHLSSWNLVMLLHGDEDCDRVVRECPAARYQFPSVTPENNLGSSTTSTRARRKNRQRRTLIREKISRVNDSEGGTLLSLADLLSVELIS